MKILDVCKGYFVLAFYCNESLKNYYEYHL